MSSSVGRLWYWKLNIFLWWKIIQNFRSPTSITLVVTLATRFKFWSPKTKFGLPGHHFSRQNWALLKKLSTRCEKYKETILNCSQTGTGIYALLKFYVCLLIGYYYHWFRKNQNVDQYLIMFWHNHMNIHQNEYCVWI